MEQDTKVVENSETVDTLFNKVADLQKKMSELIKNMEEIDQQHRQIAKQLPISLELF